MIDDAELFRQARHGDNAAFEMLIRRYFRPAYLIALAQLGESSDAEDACQDAFVRCWERLAECRDPGRVGGWMLRVVRNTARNSRRWRRVRDHAALHDAALVSNREMPLAAVERRELGQQLHAALMRLPETQREVILLHDLEGWAHAEIATYLGISELMSRRHVSDARKRLRNLLGPTVRDDHV
jgi:RNA polymerase sigma-70 factor (ECF subfamily)